MNTSTVKRDSKIVNRKMVLLLLTLLGIGHSVIAESSTTVSASKGFYFSLPAYLFGTSSAFGIQGGYQFERVNVRFDLDMVDEFAADHSKRILMTSLSLFFSKHWQEGIRVYQGLTVGGEFGIQNTFDGQVYFVNCVVGAEFLSFGKNTLFFEFGPGIGIFPKNGAFNGGTVIGGGIRRFL